MGNVRSKLGEMLHTAIKEGRKDDALDLLKSGVHVDIFVENKSVIYTAVLHRQYDVLEYVLQHKEVNMEDGYYTETPLHCACKNSDLKAVEMLIAAGAKVNAVDQNNCTPLWLAVEAGRKDIVDFLLKECLIKVDLNTPCKDRFMAKDAKCTPINKAAEMNNTEIVRMLASHGADVNFPNNHGRVALHHACYTGNKEMVEILLNYHCEVDLVDEDSISPFYVACKHNHHEIVNLLIDQGCDVNKPRSDSGWHCRGFSPLHVATQYHQTKAVRALLAAGADVNQGDFRHVQPVALACEEGQIEILNLLLQYNADVNHKDKNGSVALAYCFEFSYPNEILKRLLQEHVDVNVRMFDQEPILHFSVRHFSVEIPSLLVNNGAKLNILDKRELNALYYSINMGKIATSSLLLVHGARITEYELENALTSLKITYKLVEVILEIINMDMIRNVLPKFESHHKEICDLVKNVLCQPSSLKRLCRDVIRGTISKKTSRSILPLIQAIKLPDIIVSYLTCQIHLHPI
ncbi:hypothetical protein SNE40_016885 [Patella caerulea]|uniref:SOCS box domain-containing protein n=2 Tax=Patella caerulea TaxID=87958 RepID=A0AAN8JDY1_PATCE